MLSDSNMLGGSGMPRGLGGADEGEFNFDADNAG